ncbi:MAG: inorganic diphosphatase [Zoogloeaceae bacterium]|jgi:inorganic pyrophosphatase|nr:inorganic diphosphatase [Zoogloeaceae bacterium]
MNIDALSIGKDIPNDFNVVIEIPANTPGIKYELDKASGAVLVDRFMSTPMHYPCDYGFIPHTLSEDGDPLDVLLIAPYPLQPGVVVRSRPLGMLEMEDEAGVDTKLVVVPVSKLTPIYDKLQDIHDLDSLLKDQIKHFFEHYKDLEKGKWVKVRDWKDAAAARQEILASVKRFAASQSKTAA